VLQRVDSMLGAKWALLCPFQIRKVSSVKFLSDLNNLFPRKQTTCLQLTGGQAISVFVRAHRTRPV
jgi:hypothetical protein